MLSKEKERESARADGIGQARRLLARLMPFWWAYALGIYNGIRTDGKCMPFQASCHDLMLVSVSWASSVLIDNLQLLAGQSKADTPARGLRL